MSGCIDSSVSGERSPISSRELALLSTCIGQDGCRLEELMPSASSTAPRRSSGTTGPNVAGLWWMATRSVGSATRHLDLDDPAAYFCRTLPFGTPRVSART